MKYLTLLIYILLLLSSCSKDKSKVNKDGLTPDITELVPQSILDEMDSLGMPIYGGALPPELDGSFYVDNFVLLSSNRPSDVVGQTFSDYTFTFHDQNDEKLTIKVDSDGGGEKSVGTGSFIVGEKNKFSVFVEANTTYYGSKAKLVYVISGILQSDGIKDLYYANFMIDNFGNPSGKYIENARLFASISS